VTDTSIHGEWSSKFGFIIAATGSAVGLGNIWKFPYMAGEYGGGAFVIFYLLCVALLGLPIMMAEVLLGKRGKLSPINSMRKITQNAQVSSRWSIIGWLGVLTGFLILSYYSVIAGWALAYIPRLALGTFSSINELPPDQVLQFVKTIFSNLISDPERLLAWHSLFMGATVIVIAYGVEAGLEKSLRFMMPALFALLFILLGYSMVNGDFMAGFHFMFDIDFHRFFYPHCTPTACEFNGEAPLAAMGQAFFTLSLGMGAIMVYGAYLPKHAKIGEITAIVVIADTLAALLAGLIIFPIVFSNGLDPNQGVGLVFHTLPIAFGKMLGGSIFGALFFLLLVLAAWSSAISIIEPIVAWLIESKKMSRLSAALLCGGIAWMVGFVTILSFNLWQEVKLLPMIPLLADKTPFDLIDFFTSNVMLPVGGLLIALFVGWVLPARIVSEELEMTENQLKYRFFRFLLRFIAPLGIGLVLLNLVGIL